MSVHVTRSCLLRAASLCLLAVSTAVPAQAPAPDPRGAWHEEGRARDPGVRAAPSSEIPNPVPGLNQNEALLFIESPIERQRAMRSDHVDGALKLFGDARLRAVEFEKKRRLFRKR